MTNYVTHTNPPYIIPILFQTTNKNTLTTTDSKIIIKHRACKHKLYTTPKIHSPLVYNTYIYSQQIHTIHPTSSIEGAKLIVSPSQRWRKHYPHNDPYPHNQHPCQSIGSKEKIRFRTPHFSLLHYKDPQQTYLPP